jgi:hypothetical protein
MSLLQTHPTVRLSDILTKEQLAETVRIMNLGTGFDDAVIRLKSYYGSFRQELLARQVDSDYLAYAVPYAILKGVI